MRKLLVGVLGLVLVLVVLIVAAVFIPSPLQKWAVERGATMATGRQVTIGGPFSLRAWPPVEITASDVRIANADWGTAPELARIGTLDASLDLLAYWREGRIQLDRLIVSKPEANLEVAQDGRKNWEFANGQPAGKAPAAQGAPAPIPPFVLGDVRITDGVVAYDDKAAGTSKRAEAIALSVKQAAPEQPVAIDGGLTFEGQPATLTGSVDRPQGAAAGERSPIRLTLGVPGATVALDGEIETKAPAAAGALEVKLTAPRELLAWLGATPPDGLPASATLQGQLDASASRVALSGLQLQADQLSASGQAAVDLAQPPKVTGDLALGRLDLSPYMASGQASGAPAPEASAGWPETPIDLPLPLPVDIDLKLHGAGVKAGKFEVGDYATHILADRQQAGVTIESLAAYGGNVKGRLAAQAAEPPAYTVDLDAGGISVVAATDAITGLHRVDGRGAAKAKLATRGGNVRALVGALGGDASVTVTDGALLGINVAGMLRQIMTAGLDRSAADTQRTDFAEAGASFHIENGVARTQDLRLVAPVLRLDGAGAVDLPRQTIDMRVTPKLASTLQGQGATGEPVLQAGIPFVLQGPYTSPEVRFDLNGTLTGAISGPADVAKVAADLAQSPEAVKALKDQFQLLDKLPVPAAGAAGEVLEGVLGGGGKQQQKPPAPVDAGKAAKGLLKGLTGQ
ncbi:MAG: AsmA family protein [Geminicoccaceae bacterium]